MREIKNKACFICLDNLYSPLRGKCRVIGVEIRLCIWECDYLRNCVSIMDPAAGRFYLLDYNYVRGGKWYGHSWTITMCDFR